MKSHLAILVAMVMLVAFSGLAQAAVLTFDNLPATDSAGVHIPSGYGGFTWSTDFYYLTSTNGVLSGSGYPVGAVSSPNVAFNFGMMNVSVSNATPFTFNGAYFTAAWDSTLNIGIEGYNRATLKHSTTVTATGTSSTYASLNWSGITELTFTSNGGQQFAMDNFTYNVSTVPLPRTLLLFGPGLFGLAAFRKRFNK